jgi:hypothetical protein
MKLGSPGGILAILGALIVVFGGLHHFLFAKQIFTFTHASIIIAAIGVVVLVVGVLLGMSGSSK